MFCMRQCQRTSETQLAKPRRLVILLKRNRNNFSLAAYSTHAVLELVERNRVVDLLRFEMGKTIYVPKTFIKKYYGMFL